MKRRILILMMTILLPLAALLIGDSFSVGQVMAEGTEPTIPVVRIYNTKVKDGEETGQAAVDRMNASEDHSVHCEAIMDIEVPAGFSYVDSDAKLTSLKDLKIDIRGRGNTTWLFEGKKKPYKIELDKKSPILGMGSNKHWALIANVYDPSLMRNRITYWLGHELDMAFTPYGYPVDVYMEDQYLGSYLLCETIRIDKNRINIDELTQEDKDPDVITGGYLMATLQDRGSISTFTTDKGENLQNDRPSFDPSGGGKADYENDNQKNYIRNYVQEAEYALNEGYVKDENEPSGYRKVDYKDYFDLKSTSLYWLMQEFSRNSDAYNTGSSYFYKTRDKDGQKGKIYWGPLWDFDFGWDCNDFEDDDAFETSMGWMTAMLADKKEGCLADQIHKDWPVLKAKLQYITQQNGLLDQYYKEVKTSQAADYESNHIDDYDDFEKAVNHLRDWIDRRIAWMDKKIENDLDNYACKVILKSDPDDEYPQVFSVLTGQIFYKGAVEPEKDGKVFMGWYTEDGKNLDNISLEGDTVVTARFIDYDEAIKPEKIYLGCYDKWVPYTSEEYIIDYTVIPENAEDKKIKWTSSDESIATIGKDDHVIFHSKGEVTVTGTYRNGLSTSFQLHICDKEELALPVSAKLSEEVIRMEPGEYRQLRLTVTPSNSSYTVFMASENDDVAQIDMNGVITAKGNGKAQIFVSVTNDFGEDLNTLELTCQVIVGPEDSQTRLGTPKVTAKVYPDKKVKLSWKKIKGATGYKVAYRKAGAKKWTIKNVTGTKATIKGLKAGNRYQFKVAAVIKTGKTKMTGAYSPVLYRYCQAAKGLKCTGKKKAVRVSWKKIKGASGYRILVSRNKNLEKAKVIKAKSKKTAYLVKSLESKKKYYIGLQPYKRSGGKTYLGVIKKKAVKTR